MGPEWPYISLKPMLLRSGGGGVRVSGARLALARTCAYKKFPLAPLEVAMIITCPSCSTRYKLDPTQFGAEGRRVRCTNCAHVWTQKAPDDLPKPVTEPPPELRLDDADVRDLNDDALAAPRGPSPELAARIAARQRAVRQEESKRGRAGWLVLALVLVSAVVALVLAREAVVRAWPPAERLYALAGITPPKPGEGLKIKVIEHRRDTEGDAAVLVVKGEVTNTSDVVRDVPRLRASLRNEAGAELLNWTFATAQARLLPGETAPFVTRIENPSTEAAALNIDFTTGGN